MLVSGRSYELPDEYRAILTWIITHKREYDRRAVLTVLHSLREGAGSRFHFIRHRFLSVDQGHIKEEDIDHPTTESTRIFKGRASLAFEKRSFKR